MLPDIKAKLLVYRDLLSKWQKSVNLVAPSTLAHAWERHFEDSLQLIDLIPQNAAIADLGSGAGFPGLVIAIARPDVNVNLIESDHKKGTFLLAVSRETGVQNVHIFQERIESVLPDLRVDIITARALAPLADLLRLTHSQLSARCLFLKGEAWQKEIDLAKVDHVFDVDVKPSKTEPAAAVLSITNRKA
jgi:16S rRNA (guanine527-N7)-methyltransferase